ncbi:E3 ubiquitin-protein ligase [Toxocara canis]|uniref:E3 ubiquitin-protein ligase n=1 Tax=Toxocara canis TaxID=6265 RepID=A0A0B2VPI9_TOXCA|nr:E3 ubiquitin-protein ligase [Toxocara canis]
MGPKTLRVKSTAGTNSDKNGKESCQEEECSICCQPFTLKATLPDCGHSFCFLCIKGVARRRAACPLCRKPIVVEIFRDPILISDERSTSQPSCSQQVVREESPQGECSSQEIGEREQQSNQVVSKSEARWLYQARLGDWWRYEQRQEQDIEEAFQRGDSQIDLLIAGYTYCINFTDSCQYRKDLGRSTHWERAVKRVVGDEVDVPIRGIAGVRTPSVDLSANQITSAISKVELDK